VSSITKLLRVEKEINLKSKLDLNTFTLTEELLNSVTTDSESKVFYYVFATSNALTVSLNTRKWSSSFSKYLVTEGFKGVLTDYKLGYEKHINYLKQTNREQYALMLSIHDYDQTIESKKLKASDSEDNKKFQKELETDVLEDGKKFLQRSLKEKDEYLGAAIKEEREYLETALKEKDKFLETALKGKDDYLGDALKEKDEYLENSLKAKDDVIRDMENSFSFRIMRKLDKLLGRKHKNK